MESLRSKVIVQTYHSAILDITQQSSITSTNFTIQFNIRMVRASRFIRKFSKLEIRHKPVKDHIVTDTLSRLASPNTNIPSLNPEYSELDVLFTYTTTLIDIHPNLIKRIIDSYKANEWWSKLLRHVEDNEALGGDKAILTFVKEIPMPTDSELYFTPWPELPNLIFREVSQRPSFSRRAESASPVDLAQSSRTSHLELASDRDRRLWNIQNLGLKLWRRRIKVNFSIILTNWQEYTVCVYLLQLQQKS